jgi:glycine cleavage system H protein
MMIPQDLKYAESHEWIRVDGNVATVGISHYAQDQLSDVVFVEVPEVDQEIEQGGECAVIESCKIAAEMYAPAAGKVTAVNEALEDDPALVNKDPYGDGWIFKLELCDASQLDGLMDAEAYKNHIAQSA